MAELFSILTYDFFKAPPSLNITDVYATVSEIISPVREAGIYEYGMSVTWTFDRTTNSAFMRFSTNGGTTWNEFTSEPKDSTDANAFYYAFPQNVAASGVLQLTLQARKETGAGTMDINFADLWIKRIN